MADLSKCRSCGASVVWLENNRTGKRAPIDAQPSEDGNILLDRHAGTYQVLASSTDRALAAGHLHTNHFMTCKTADQWRTPKKAKA